MRIFTGETENVVVAPADGKIVVIEEVEENEYFHDRRKMVSVLYVGNQRARQLVPRRRHRENGASSQW